MIKVEHKSADVVTLTLEEVKRIRSALSCFDAQELAEVGYGNILERLRLAIPQQWG